jgi:abortive infection bacteriophage resistance protein
MRDVKPSKDYDEQIEILRSRGCLVESSEECQQQLARINYYRLSAYFLPYTIGNKENEKYAPKTSMRVVIENYEFDRKMRNILSLALEEVEIGLRSTIAYFHAQKYGALGYMDPDTHTTEHSKRKKQYNHAAFLKLFWGQISSNGSLVTKHHMKEYGGNFPIWVAVEFFTFGMLSRFFSDMKPADRKKFVRGSFGTNDADEIESALRCCTDLRNICAHYGRLYYRVFSAIPKGVSVPSKDDDKYAQRRLFSQILAIRRLYVDPIKWNSEVVEQIKALVDTYGDSIYLHHIGFPQEWESLLMRGSAPL